MKRRRNSAFTAPLTLKSPAGSPDLTLRTMDAADQEEWGRLRSVNERWLAPWESSDPHGTEPLTFKSWVNRQREEEREGTSIIFLMEHEGEIVGQISLGAIYPGPMRTGIIGYWIDEDHAGRGLTPLAVAMLADWALLDPTGPQLHRLEIDIVPEMSVPAAWCRRSGRSTKACAVNICMCMGSGATTSRTVCWTPMCHRGSCIVF